LALVAMTGAGLAQPRVVTPQADERTIGSWRLSCIADPMTDQGRCLLRHTSWIEPAQSRPDGSAAPGLALEAVRMGGRVLPAITLRGLSMADASRAALGLASAAELRFDRHPLMALGCGLDGGDLVCLPEPADADRAAAELVSAKTVLMRMRGSTPLPVAGPIDPVALDLSETQDAVRALAEKGTAEQATPVRPGLDLRNLVERWLRGG